MSSLVSIPVASIRYRQDARPRSDADLSSLSESIARHGLMNPIRVRQVGQDSYEVVAGAHRLQATDLLGYAEIACFIVDDDDLAAEMAMLAENLHRADLSTDERNRQIRRYAELLAADRQAKIQVGQNGRPEFPAGSGVGAEALDAPEIGYGKPPPQTKGIATQIAQETGLSERTVRRVLSDKPPTRKPEGQKRGGIAGRYASSDTRSEPPSKVFERFIALVDEIETLPVADLVAAAGARRAVLNHRASSLADRMDEIMRHGD